MKFTDNVILVFTGHGKQYRKNTLLARTQAFNKLLQLDDYEYFTFEIPPESTDGASIPRLFWFIISPVDWRILYPSQIHDYLYNKKEKILEGKVYDKVSDTYRAHIIKVKYTRSQADWILREKMKNFGGGSLLRNGVYLIVRIFGIFAFK